MANINLKLNTESSIHKELQSELQTFLNSLTKGTTYSTEKQKEKVGALGGHEIVQFVIESATAVVPILSGLLALYQQLRSSSGKKSKDSKSAPDMTITVNDTTIKL